MAGAAQGYMKKAEESMSLGSLAQGALADAGAGGEMLKMAIPGLEDKINEAIGSLQGMDFADFNGAGVTPQQCPSGECAEQQALPDH